MALLLAGWTGLALGAPALHRPLHLVGVDQFGRTLQSVDSFRSDRHVGMFFWLWIGQPYARGIYDATEILSRPDGQQRLFFQSDSLSPDGSAHFWGQPLWGYYNSDDEWVIRRQIEMITMAGVDFIVFDATNALTYKNVYLKVLAVIDEYRRAGWAAPQIAFFTHSLSLQTVRRLYDELYRPRLFADTWYCVEGKPLIIAYTNPRDDRAEALSRGDTTYHPASLSAEVLDFFHFRKPQWPFDPFMKDAFAWIEWKFPQPVHTDMMSVTVASHPQVPFSFSLTRGHVNWGRGWSPDLQRNVAEEVDRGTFFQRQWDHAIEVSPPTVFVCGWNEWIAYKQIYQGEYMMCDAVNREYSRDIEPMSGGYQDAFYLQLMRNIRRYKGVENDTVAHNPMHRIRLDRGLEQWAHVSYRCENMERRPMERDSYGAARTVRYVQPAPPNTLREVRVTHDREKLYFLIRWSGSLTASGVRIEPQIWIGTGSPEAHKGWCSYEYCVTLPLVPSSGSVAVTAQATCVSTAHSSRSSKRLSALHGSPIHAAWGQCSEAKVDRLDEQFGATYCCAAELSRVDSCSIQVAVPRRMLGLDRCDQFYFKVAQGVAHPDQIMDYYKTGTVMPLGRLSYSYRF